MITTTHINYVEVFNFDIDVKIEYYNSQSEWGSPLMVAEAGRGRLWLAGLLSWDSADGYEGDAQARCVVTGLPSVFTNITDTQAWIQSVTRTT